MNAAELTLTVHEAPVEVTMALPEGVNADNPDARLPVALFCAAPPYRTGDEAWRSLRGDLWRALNRRRIIMAWYAPRCTETILEEFHDYSIDDNLDDAAAVFRALQVHDAVDPARIAVIGAGLAATTALTLSERTKQIVARVLISAALPECVSTIWANGDAPDDVDADLLPQKFRDAMKGKSVTEALREHPLPTLIVHGAADTTAAAEPAAALATAANDASDTAAATSLLVPFADHLFTDADDRGAAVDTIAVFLADALSGAAHG